jgi:hypothetical protein
MAIGRTLLPVGGSPTNIIPARLTLPYSGIIDNVGDLGWHWANGSFDYNDPDGIPQELDPTAGADYFFTLKHNNAFGNKLRFTDDQGVGGATGRFDFAGSTVTPNSVGATPGYFIDHLTGNGYTQYPVASVKNYVDSLALAHAFTLGGYSGFRMINEVEALSLCYSLSLIHGLSFTSPDIPFVRGGSTAASSFDPTPGGTINQSWVNRYITGTTGARAMQNFRLRVTDLTASITSLIGTYAVRKHF